MPELLQLQSPLTLPPAHDETLFIIVQQAQELWFKQILHELKLIIQHLAAGKLFEATRLLRRINAIMSVVNAEVRVLETMPPHEFQKFRSVLDASSGFQSEQFRELEWASGLRDSTFLKVLQKHMDEPRLMRRWPQTLADTCYARVAPGGDVTEALVTIYADPAARPELFALCEEMSEYDLLFTEWRFRHHKLVERTIGGGAPGTAGSSGAGYLGKTLAYRFFPELWEARTRLSGKNS